jgi:hypothetical protein
MKKLGALFICAMLTAVTSPTSVVIARPSSAEATVVKEVAKKPHKKAKHHKVTPRQIARHASRSLGHNLREWRCLDILWTHESHFNPKARNKHSGAYGIAQFMPKTWSNYKVKKTSNASLQIKYGLRYIDKRYGSPCAAWKHWRKHHWY